MSRSPERSEEEAKQSHLAQDKLREESQCDTSESERLPRKITILGLSFKKDVKSFETSHTLKLIHLLKEKGYDVTVHDPFLDNTQLPTANCQPTFTVL